MNCIKGDIARIVYISPALADLADRFVRCVAPTIVSGHPGWILDRTQRFVLGEKASIGCCVYQAGELLPVTAIRDSSLRPIHGLTPDEAFDIEVMARLESEKSK